MSLIRKAVVVILDGLGDRPCRTLGGATPLEAAAIPNLDRLAETGLAGLMDPLFPGVAVGTHTGTALLLGLPVREVPLLARGPVEAAGIGVPLRSGDIAIRCNFATLQDIEGALVVLDRRAGRISAGTEELAALLQDVDLGNGIRASLYPATQHRAVLRLSGSNLSAAISDTDPDNSRSPMPVLTSQALVPEDERAALTAEAVNRFLQVAHKRLRDAEVNRIRRRQGLPPADGVITRGAGKLEPLHSLINRFGLKAAVVAAEDTVVGLARLFGYHAVQHPSFTALPDTDLAAKVAAAKGALGTHDLVFLHVKGADISAHDRRPDEKQALLERFDRELGPFLGQGYVIAVTGDHSTDSNSGCHCGDPVPALLHDPEGRRDFCSQFSESGCLHGGMGRVTATGFLVTVLDAMGALPQFKESDFSQFF